MTLATCGEGRWVIVDGLPLLLTAAAWLGLLLLSLRLLLRDREATPPRVSPARQTQVYRWGGGLLLIFGALGGFGPSVSILLARGQVWSVNRQAPHSDADAALAVHITLAVVWALLFGIQLWSAGVRGRRTVHRVVGFAALAAALLGISLAGGFVWTAIHDFAQGLRGPFAKAGMYTVAMGIGVAVNAVMTGVYAAKRNFVLHKDFALMTLFWTLDPGVHRLYMWLMRAVCWDCWAPECTSGAGIAIAKLPANLSLIVWALVVARMAGRLNWIVALNVAGQYLLWTWGTYGLVTRTLGLDTARLVALVSILLGVVTLGIWRRSVRGDGA